MDTNMRRVGYFLFFVFILQLAPGCTLANRGKWKKEKIASEQQAVKPSRDKDKGDAYLYDLKIYNKGKKNSVRLDLYLKGDSLAAFARGYLGKGVLKGLVNSDSLVTFFPTENQFYSGKISQLLTAKCFKNIPLEKMLVDFFKKTPDKIDYEFGDAYLNIVNEVPGYRKYRLMAKNCSESIELDYDWKNGQFVLEKFIYSSDDGLFKIDAKRRKFKFNIKLPDGKYKVSIPATASRIYP